MSTTPAPIEQTLEQKQKYFEDETNAFVQSLVGEQSFLFTQKNLDLIAKNLADLGLDVNRRTYRIAYLDLLERVDHGGLDLKKPEPVAPAPASMQTIAPPARATKHSDQSALQVNGQFVSRRATKGEQDNSRAELIAATQKTDRMIKDATLLSQQEREIANTVITGPGGKVNHARTQAARDALRAKYGIKK
jgi:hypothetical protein